MKFTYTDLSKDTGSPWFSCHLTLGRLSNGDPRIELDQCFDSLLFWRWRLLLKALPLLFTTSKNSV